MNANTEIDLAKLHDAIVADIQAQFPDYELVEFYRGQATEDRKSLPKPACLLDLIEFENTQDADPETSQIAMIASFEAELVIGFKEAKAKLAIRQRAAAMAAFLHKRRWNNPDIEGKKLPTGPVIVTGCYLDDFKGLTPTQKNTPLDQFEIWRIEWQQIIHLGTSVWKEDGATPDKPVYSWSPDIGIGNEDAYQDL